MTQQPTTITTQQPALFKETRGVITQKTTTMSQKCLKCQQKNRTCYLFLTCGKFCNRTVGVELSQHPVKDCDDNIIIGKNLFFCYDCAIEEACDNPNVAGYLTQTDYQKYKSDAKRSFQFMQD